MPFIHELEEKYPVSSGLLVVGVHSAKFPNEKIDENIKNAISRYSIQHPVVNDNEIKIWEEFAVKCWPTLILLSPTGKILFSIPGEFHLSFIQNFIDVALEFYSSKMTLNKSLLANLRYSDNLRSIQGYGSGVKNEKLRFPGKVAIDDTGERLAISDSGNNRIIVSSLNGAISHIIGGKGSGFIDGVFDKAEFNSPQGVAWHGSNTIFVADCNNHAIRKVDLLVKRVVTVAGTGVQGSDLEGGSVGTEQHISSPWDVVVGGSPRLSDGRSILYIAMSGCHQIWAFFLKTTDYQKGSELEMGTCIRYAGNGNEENRNNSYPHKAGFAQPSGLAVDEDGHLMFVADSESSTIRKINLANGAVQALVGGDIDPMNLFSYGDIDGKGRDAKLQHPIGVAWDHKRNLLYVADTYNHKIKIVDVKKKTCQTMTNLLSKEGKFILNEPSGLVLDSECKNLYIADTNNHQIIVVSLGNNEIRKINFYFDEYLENLSLEKLSVEEVDGPENRTIKFLTSKSVPTVSLDSCMVNPKGTVNITMSSHKFHLNPEAPSIWQISYSLDKEPDAPLYLIHSRKYELSGRVSHSISVGDILPDNDLQNLATDTSCALIFIECILYHCRDDSGLCEMHSYKSSLPLQINLKCESFAVDINIPIS